MFQLSQTHNQAFQSKAEADFVREVMQYLRENHAETIVKLPNGEFTVADLPEEILQKMVTKGIEKSLGYGISTEVMILFFVEIMFMYSPNFDLHPQLSKILKSYIIFPNWKIALLLEQYQEDNLVWILVKRNYDPDLWMLDVK